MIRKKLLQLRDMEHIMNTAVSWKIQAISRATNTLEDSIGTKELEGQLGKWAIHH